mmetsp:Transcript_80568/g.148242  ORF Transcript_80568/g.148242 Transcript_80568/m.148242 type:complete len:134 (+) Transcript_80568:319-720(+)
MSYTGYKPMREPQTARRICSPASLSLASAALSSSDATLLAGENPPGTTLPANCSRRLDSVDRSVSAAASWASLAACLRGVQRAPMQQGCSSPTLDRQAGLPPRCKRPSVCHAMRDMLAVRSGHASIHTKPGKL